LPAPLRARFANLHGGNVANAYLYVKASALYKVGGAQTPQETRELAWALTPAMGPAETLSTSPFSLDESQLSDIAPANAAYSDLPAFIAVDGARGLEKLLKDRLDDALSTELLYDRETRTLAHPGETIEAFAARVQDTPALEAKRRNLERKLAAKRGDIEQRRHEAKARGFEKWASLGTSILSNIGIFTGRKRTVTGVGGVLSKQRMEGTARSRIERLEAEAEDLENQLQELSPVDYDRFERRIVKPTATGVSLIRYEIVWVT
jgi:hypothetical protein